jgi:hypothetical protein
MKNTKSSKGNDKRELRRQLNTVRKALAEIVRENYDAVQREKYKVFQRT